MPTDDATRYVPAFLPQGPAPAHTLTITIRAHHLGGFDVDARCDCQLPSRTPRLDLEHHGWSALYGADDDGEDLEPAVAEAVDAWTVHREECARVGGPAVLR